MDLDWFVGLVMCKNADGAVAQYLHGKTQVLGYLVGQTLKLMEHKGQPEEIRAKLLEHLEIWRNYYGGPGDPPFSTIK